MVTPQTVWQSLHDIEGTVEAMANTLHSLGFMGLVNDAHENPLARYLAKTLESPGLFSVTPYFIRYEHFDDWFQVPSPTFVYTFLLAFDAYSFPYCVEVAPFASR